MRKKAFKFMKLEVRGGLSFILAISIFWTSSLALATYNSSYKRGKLLAIDRLSSIQLDHILSLYNRELLERYGLWGLTNASLPFNDLMQAYQELETQEEKFLLEAPLRGELLERKIIEFTRGRIHLSFIDELMELYDNFNAISQLITENDIPNTLEKIKEILPKIPSDKADKMLPSSSDKLKYDIAEGNAGNEIDEIENIEELKNFFLEIDGLGELDASNFFEGFEIGFINKENLISSLVFLLENTLEIFNQEDSSGINSLLINEYILYQFVSATRGPDAKTEAGKNFISFSGKALKSYTHSERFEAEKILLGTNGEYATLLRLSQLLTGTRLIMHYIPQIINESHMKGHLAKASILSSVIAALSLGTVIIEPQSLAYLLALIPAFVGSLKDIRSLVKGEKIPLYPDKSLPLSKYEVDYIDHLRFFALFTNEERKIASLEKYLFQNVKGEFFTEINIQLLLRNGKYYEKKHKY